MSRLRSTPRRTRAERRIGALFGTGLLSLDALLFTLALVGSLVWNLYQHPDTLALPDWAQTWLVVLVGHAVIVAGFALVRRLRDRRRPPEPASYEWVATTPRRTVLPPSGATTADWEAAPTAGAVWITERAAPEPRYEEQPAWALGAPAMTNDWVDWEPASGAADGQQGYPAPTPPPTPPPPPQPGPIPYDPWEPQPTYPVAQAPYGAPDSPWSRGARPPAGTQPIPPAPGNWTNWWEPADAAGVPPAAAAWPAQAPADAPPLYDPPEPGDAGEWAMEGMPNPWGDTEGDAQPVTGRSDALAGRDPVATWPTQNPERPEPGVVGGEVEFEVDITASTPTTSKGPIAEAAWLWLGDTIEQVTEDPDVGDADNGTGQRGA